MTDQHPAGTWPDYTCPDCGTPDALTTVDLDVVCTACGFVA